MRVRAHLVVLLLLVGAALVAPAAAGAAPGDVVDNPGYGALTVGAGSSLVLGSLTVPLPADGGTPECADGLNNDVDAWGGAPQDALIDGADPECSGPTDVSESAVGLQTKPLVGLLSLGVDADGAFTAIGNPSYTETWVWTGPRIACSGRVCTSLPGSTLQVKLSFDTDDAVAGSIDPSTGALEVSTSMAWEIPGFCGETTAVDLTTDPAAPSASGPLGDPEPYDQLDGSVTLVDDQFSVTSTCWPVAPAGAAPAAGQSAVSLVGWYTRYAPAPTGPFVAGAEVVAGDLGGQVVDELTGLPVAGARVGLYSAGATGRLATATTAADGTWSFPGIAAGSYRVKAWHPDGSYVPEWWDDAATYVEGGTLMVSGGGTTSATVALSPAAATTGTVRGRVVDAVTGLPVAGAAVRLYTPSGFLAGVTTGSGGYYVLPFLAPRADYAVRVSATGFQTEWHVDAATYFASTSIGVVVGSATTADVGLAPI